MKLTRAFWQCKVTALHWRFSARGRWGYALSVRTPSSNDNAASCLCNHQHGYQQRWRGM